MLLRDHHSGRLLTNSCRFVPFLSLQTETEALEQSLDSFGSLPLNHQLVKLWMHVEVTQTAEGALVAKFGGETRRIFGMEEPLGLCLVVNGDTILM
jgi:hypothetical protein